MTAGRATRRPVQAPWWLAAALSCLAPCLATASPPPATAATVAQNRQARAQAVRARAQELLTEGYELARARDFAGALAKFEAAYALVPSAKLLLNMGTSLRHLGRHAEAAEVYERYLKHSQADPQRRRELLRILGEIDDAVGRLRITVQPRGATVRINGRLLDGFAGAAAVRIDPGEQTVVIQWPDRPPHVETFHIAAGQQRSLQVHIPAVHAAGDSQRTAAYAVGTVGVAGLAVGVLFGALALSTESELEDDPAPELETAADQYTTGAVIGLVAGGAALATAVVVYLTAPDGPATPMVTLAALGRAGPGVTLGLRW